MPKLSDTMTEGRLVSWKKSVGEKVERGEIIAEVETDKATMELEAFASGTLLEIRVKPGEMAPVGTVIGIVGVEGGKTAGSAAPGVAAPEKDAALKSEKSAAEKPDAEAAAEKAPKPSPATENLPPAEPAGKPAEADEVVEGGAEVVPSPAPATGEEKASPMVRRLAREKGIDLGQVKGSGPEGRVLQEDLEKAGIGTLTGLKDRGSGTGEDQKTVAGAEGAGSLGGGIQPLSRMRAAIARTVSEAWRTIPHFSVTVEVEMGEAERVRHELKGSGTPVSLNDFVIKATAAAIGRFSLVNGSFSADGITIHPDINIGIAVALDDGLLVPVIRGCQGLTLKEIAAGSSDLIARAKAGKIVEAEITGGTFSISNLGMFGVDEFTAVIHPSQGAILAVSAVGDRPVIKGGHLVAGRMMRMTLSADHRLIDGAYAARFLREVKRILENPVVMLV
jgi:pyruvate dehydrogenase E2 component (dihydrolipoamide acetyltransferase)